MDIHGIKTLGYTVSICKLRWLSKSKVLSRVFELCDQIHRFSLNKLIFILWYVLIIRLGAVNLHAILTILNHWLHWIRVCNATIDMVFILKFWNLPFERFESSPNVVLWLYSMTCIDCPCVVTRGIARKKFLVLGISGVCIEFGPIFIQVRFYNMKIHWGLWSRKPP